jgi:hypothetical protein
MRTPKLEPDDFYIDHNGLMVLTEKYLRKRGHCCKNSCRHCPYGFRKEKSKKE